VTHLYFIPLYILAYFTGARGMYSLLIHMDQPRLTKVVHSHYEAAHEERDLDLSRNWRVVMAFLWVPLIVATIAVLTGLGTYKYVTKPMVTPAEHAERKRRKRAEVEAAVKQAEHELAQTRELVPHHLPQVQVDRHMRTVTNPVNPPHEPCQCGWCRGEQGIHGDEAIAYHNQQVSAYMNREEYH
jgi:hypothetical protein